MINWNEQAIRAAQHASDEMHSDHRGSMKWLTAAVVFGNDGFRQDERTRVQVDVLRQLLEEEGIFELGFGLDNRDSYQGDPVGEESKGYSWAMAVDSLDVIDLDLLHRLVWESRRIAQGAVPGEPEWESFKRAQGGHVADP